MQGKGTQYVYKLHNSNLIHLEIILSCSHQEEKHGCLFEDQEEMLK